MIGISPMRHLAGERLVVVRFFQRGLEVIFQRSRHSGRRRQAVLQHRDRGAADPGGCPPGRAEAHQGPATSPSPAPCSWILATGLVAGIGVPPVAGAVKDAWPRPVTPDGPRDLRQGRTTPDRDRPATRSPATSPATSVTHPRSRSPWRSCGVDENGASVPGANPDIQGFTDRRLDLKTGRIIGA
jgi:hypothetical protein